MPPTWAGARAAARKEGGPAAHRTPGHFAACRPGVLWPCYQVEAERRRGAEEGPSRSWRVDEGDLYGRSLPRQGFGGVAAGAFVGQDNSATVAGGGSGGGGPAAQRASRSNWRAAMDEQAGGVAVPPPSPSRAASASFGAQQLPDSLPTAVTLRRGTSLLDEAMSGDADALLAGRASLVAVPSWPWAHPFSLTDGLGAAALVEGGSGLPLWLTEAGEAAA